MNKRAHSYLGKHLLLSLYYEDSDGNLLRHVQMHGVISRIDEAMLAVNLVGSGEEFTVPADLSALKPAPSGDYRLRPSGEIVVNPDFPTTWTITEAEKDGKDDGKGRG